MRALALIMLTGSVLASNLLPNHGKTRPPKQKTEFALSYYDLRQNLMEEIPKEGVIVEFEISETEMNIISSSDKSVTYELLIDTKKVIFPESVKLEFKSFCNQ